MNKANGLGASETDGSKLVSLANRPNHCPNWMLAEYDGGHWQLYTPDTGAVRLTGRS